MRKRKFDLQHDIPGEAIPDEWRDTVAHQARSLEGILRRFQDEVARLRRRGSSQQRQQRAAVLRELVAEAEGFMNEMAQHYVELEDEIETFRQEFQDCLELRSDVARYLRALEQVNAVLHANLAAARRVLATMVQSIGKTQG